MGSIFWCMVAAESNTYTIPDIVEEHLGWAARIFVQFSLVCDLLLPVIIYIILPAALLEHLTEDHVSLNYIEWSVIVAVLMWPLCQLPNFKDMSWVLLTGTIASWVMAVILLVRVGSNARGPPATFKGHTFMNVTKAVSFLIFSYGFGSLMPEGRRNMRYPKLVNSSIVIGCTALFFLYALFGLLAYEAYGCLVTPNILEQWQGGAVYYVASLCLVVHLIVGGAVCLNPCVVIMEEMFLDIKVTYSAYASASDGCATSERSTASHVQVETASTDLSVLDIQEVARKPSLDEMDAVRLPTFDCGSKLEKGIKHESIYNDAVDDNDTSKRRQHTPNKGKSHRQRISTRQVLKRVLFRTLLLGIALFIAILIPFFDDLTEITTGLATASQSLAMPTILYLTVFKDQLNVLFRYSLGFFVFVVYAFSATITVLAFIDIVDEASSFRTFHIPAGGNELLCPSLPVG
eukprot:Clim_evm13s10 gene=Clim_evmTU13s10